MNVIKDFPHIFMRTAPYLVLNCLDKLLERPNGTMSKKRKMNQRFYWYGSRISKETGVTYSHTHHLLQQMVNTGLVRSKKVGRITAYELTNKGQLALYTMNNILNLHKDNGVVNNHDDNGNKSNRNCV